MAFLLVMSFILPALYLYAPHHPPLWVSIPVVALMAAYWTNVMING